jgi:hypothetical protein
VPVALPRLRIRIELSYLAGLAASVLVVVAVSAVVLSAGGARHASHHSPPVGHRGPALLRNLYPARPPGPSGQLVFASRLAGPRRGTAAGEVRIYAASPRLTGMVLTAAGLRKLAPEDEYAVWLLEAHKFTNSPREKAKVQVRPGAMPRLLGVIWPAVGSSGRMTVVGRFSDATVGGLYKLEVTVQPRPSLTLPGPIVLQQFVDF